MKILESQAQFELSAVLTNTEALLYSEVFRHKMSLKIPELENKKFVILKMDPYHGEGIAENSWHLVVKQEKIERMTDETSSPATNASPWEEKDLTNEHQRDSRKNPLLEWLNKLK